MNKLLISLLLLLPLGASASSLNIVTTCNPPGGPVTVNNTGCNIIPSDLPAYQAGHAAASGSANLVLASNPGDYSSLSVQQTAYATGRESYAPNAGALWIPASSSSQINFSATLMTAGTARAGYVELVSMGGSSFDPGNSFASGQVTGYSPLAINCLSGEGGCSFDTIQRMMSFELGTTFSLGYVGEVMADSSDEVAGPSGRGLNLDYQFRFFEADGVTPVAVSETPEPTTFALLGLPLAVALIAKRKRFTSPQ